jgi:hypothetical protein
MTRQPTRTGPTRLTARRGGCRDDRGHVTGFAVIMVVAVLALAGLVLDGGLAVAAKADAFGAAQSAARAGAQRLDLTLYRATGRVSLDPVAAAAAARAWLAAAGVTGTVSATPQQVRVEVTEVADTQLLALVGVDSITVHATATAVAVRSDTG